LKDKKENIGKTLWDLEDGNEELEDGNEKLKRKKEKDGLPHGDNYASPNTCINNILRKIDFCSKKRKFNHDSKKGKNKRCR